MKGFSNSNNVHIYLASAGTGKTTALLDLMTKHVREGIPVERIAFLTFTRKGVQVARLRAAPLLGLSKVDRQGFNKDMTSSKKLNNFRTLHSLAFRATNASSHNMVDYKALKEFGEASGYDLSHTLRSRESVFDIPETWQEYKHSQLPLMESVYRENPDYALSMIEYMNMPYGDLARYMRAYSAYKEDNHLYDFTDLLENYVALGLTEDVDVVFLDEMQDSSPIQWKMVFQAFKNASHIYIAGDPKQSIFGYVGATPATLLNLRGDIHHLDISYRVPSNIQSYVDHNIVPMLSFDDGSNVKSNTEGGNVSYCTDMVDFEQHFDSRQSWMMLARNKKFLGTFEDWCIKEGVPYTMLGVDAISEALALEYVLDKLEDPRKKEYIKQCEDNGFLWEEGHYRSRLRKPIVNISTVHRVKGDESDNVLLASDISRQCYKMLEIGDGEHCIFYVATTRAKKNLYILENQTPMYYPYLF